MIYTDITVINKHSKFYPQKLLSIPDSPDVLFVKGNLDLLNSFSISIVGTRHCNVNESETVKKIAKDLSSVRDNYSKWVC